MPLRAHVASLALVLLALVPVVGTSASFSTDEGAAIVGARSLARGGGWTVDHPVPEVDPDGRHYPLELSERGPRGFVPFGKHPLYVVLVAGADRVGGVTAMVLLSLAGTVAAAALAAALARRLDDSLARPALWVVGLASPLLFDGFLVMAHTLGAALAAAAVLAAVVALERRSAALALAVAPLVAGAVLMRNEALFLALGLAVVAGVIALRRLSSGTGDGRRGGIPAGATSSWGVPAAVVAVGALVAGTGAHLLETRWLARITGGTAAAVRAAPASGDPAGFVAGRWRGFLRTVVTPSYGGDELVTVLLLAMVAAIAVTAVTVRSHPERRGAVVAGASVAAGAAVLALVRGPATVVPGLLVAFPLAGAGLLLLRGTTLRTTTARVSFGVFAVFAVCVVASQYAVGGSTEWGGRFFALGLPLVVPVLLLALKEQGRRVGRGVGRWAVTALAVCSVAMATLSISSLRHQHRRLGQLVAMADAAGQVVGERPVMISTYGSVPRWAWATFDRQRWLTSAPEELEGLLSRLRAAGVDRVGLVTPDLARDRAALGSSVVMSSGEPSLARGWHVLVIDIAVGPATRAAHR